MDQLLSPKGGQKSLLLGNEAIVRGALEAGMAFATCYPGTPSSEVPDNLHRLMRAHPDEIKYKFEYSVNEKVALETAAGAAVTGLRTLCTMKHVGMNVAADPMLTLAYTGVRAGMVILCADDPSLFSSQNEQDNRYYARMSGLPMLEPADPAQAKAMVKYAYELSEKLESPVILRTTTRVNHARSQVEFDDLAETVTKGKFIKEPTRFATVPAVSRNLHLRLLRIIEQAKEISEQCEFNATVGSGKLGVITSGVCVNYVADALDDLNANDKVMVLNLGMSFPLPENKIASLLEACDKVLVVEELEPIVEQAARPSPRSGASAWRSAARRRASSPRCRWTWLRPRSSPRPLSTRRAWSARPLPRPLAWKTLRRPLSTWLKGPVCPAGRRTCVRAAPTGPRSTRSRKWWALRRSSPRTSAATPWACCRPYPWPTF